MAKIRDAKPKNPSGAYERVFDSKELGDLITKIQSTSIRNGNELEKIIKQEVNNEYIIDDFDYFLQNFNPSKQENITKLLSKEAIQKFNKKHSQGEMSYQPDFIVIKIDVKNKSCYIIELKDSYNFDTKKSDGEKQHLLEYKDYLSKIIDFDIKIKFCCFNETDKHKIRTGSKNRFEIDEIMTGKEFCDLLKIDYDKIVKMRKQDVIDNLEYFITELLKIEKIKSLIEEKLK